MVKNLEKQGARRLLFSVFLLFSFRFSVPSVGFFFVFFIRFLEIIDKMTITLEDPILGNCLALKSSVM
jgi:hypothetical protein